MRFTRIKLGNWRNFVRADVELQERMFLVGPNASGKSNFLDAFRFLRDLADPQWGFQRAVSERQGLSSLRSLSARGRKLPSVSIEVEALLSDKRRWRYQLEFTQDRQGRPIVRSERVMHGGRVLLDRPNEADRSDSNRLTQTYLEQVSTNKAFRALAEFFSQLHYLHIVPQLVRAPERSSGRSRDPYGGDFLQQLAAMPVKTQEARLQKIRKALEAAVPQLEDLSLEVDARGTPHLVGRQRSWGKQAGWQSEKHFSDGTLRLLGLLWALLDGESPLLLEEPELSLNAAVVRQLPRIMARINRKHGRQLLVSTHSVELLMDEGIGPGEILLLSPTPAGTEVKAASEVALIRQLVEAGLPMGEAVLPRTAPAGVEHLSLFGE